MENSLKAIKPTFNEEVEAKIKSLGEIESNIEKVKTFAEGLNKYYSTTVFSEEDLKQAKEEKAQVNKFKTKIADYRKDILKKWKEPINQFESLAKETERILIDTYDKIDEQTRRFDEKKKNEKELALREFFGEYKTSNELDFVRFEDIRTKYYFVNK